MAINGMEKNITKQKLFSVLITMAYLFNSICFLVNLLLPSITDFGDYFIIILLLIGGIICMISSFRINLTVLGINGFLLLFMIISYFYYDSDENIRTLLFNFVVWGICVTIIMTQKYDAQLMLDLSFGVSAVVMVLDILTNADENYDALTWTYSVLPCIAVTIVHFFYSRSNKLIAKVVYFVGLLMIVKFILNANRGGLLSLITVFIMLTFKKKNEKNNTLKCKWRLGTFLLIILIILVLLIKPVSLFVYDTLSTFGIEVSAIKKMSELIETNNIANNREELYDFAWNGFLHSPAWGNGIGGFSVNHGGWVHNIILQLFYEGGLLLALIVFIPLVRNCLFIIRDSRITAPEYSLFAILFSTSIPKLMFSTELWNTPTFWMLFSFCILLKSQYRKHQ